MSPVGVSLTEPVTLNGPPNSFCSALSVRSHLSSALEMSAPFWNHFWSVSSIWGVPICVEPSIWQTTVPTQMFRKGENLPKGRRNDRLYMSILTFRPISIDIAVLNDGV